MSIDSAAHQSLYIVRKSSALSTSHTRYLCVSERTKSMRNRVRNSTPLDCRWSLDTDTFDLAITTATSTGCTRLHVGACSSGLSRNRRAPTSEWFACAGGLSSFRLPCFWKYLMYSTFAMKKFKTVKYIRRIRNITAEPRRMSRCLCV